MNGTPTNNNVLVTGATGFVGRNVVRELLLRGYKPVCLVRDASKLHRQHPTVDPDRITPIIGSLHDEDALQHAADISQAVIHLVGIIIERRLRGKTFERIHVRGTTNVANAARSAGIKRFLHMSALGARPEAVSKYHQTKWMAEQYVRDSGLDWTIFRPSLIHGPDGEFMQLMKQFTCKLIPPVIPYFGSGEAKLQPVYVKDVARCFVTALRDDEAIGQVFPLGGPRVYSWKQLYNACRAIIPGSKSWKPIVSQPVPVAKLLAAMTGPPMAIAELVVPSVGMLRFDKGQVQMSQEDCICDHTIAEKSLGITMHDFEEELSMYADRID
jgi:uncharacterized protein YbjT (DUF2867 family)